MEIRKSLWIILTVFLGAIVAPTILRATTITYAVNQTVGTGSITGSITTDGTIGTLSTIDIAVWNLTLNDGTSTINLTPSNSNTQGTGIDLTASTTDLLFNFSGTDNGYLWFVEPLTGTPLWAACYVSSGNACVDSLVHDIQIYDLGGGQSYPTVAETGSQVIASVATPEPGTSSLMLIGIGLGLVLVMRKRTAQGLQQAS